MRTRFSLIMLVLGLVLLWPVPLGGALLLVTASIGLAIAVESDMAPVRSELSVELAEIDRPAA
ncbi:MAG TPA: hypothetical protein VGL92_17395 [Acidimicrobiia bacterium]|jgi:hypothetical protein